MMGVWRLQEQMAMDVYQVYQVCRGDLGLTFFFLAFGVGGSGGVVDVT